MNNHSPQRATMTGASCYRIKIRGTLTPHWADRLGGLDMVCADGITTLSGHIIDQASLHGLIMQIRDLGLPLLLVEEIDEQQLLGDLKSPSSSQKGE